MYCAVLEDAIPFEICLTYGGYASGWLAESVRFRAFASALLMAELHCLACLLLTCDEIREAAACRLKCGMSLVRHHSSEV